eukprot:15362058-Ditylum_brightwellii.AAC.1
MPQKARPCKNLDPPLPKKDGEEVHKETANAIVPADGGMPKYPNGNQVEPCCNITNLTLMPSFSTEH